MSHTPRNIQSPHTASTFWNQWNSVNPRMSLFIKITPQTFWTSVSSVGITSNTRNMTLPGHPGVTFYSTPGITPTQVEQMLDEPTNVELTGIYQTGIFEQEDVRAGKWNFATIEVFSASWDHPEYGELVHGKCKTGEVKDYQTFFTAEARGLMNLLSQDVNKVTSRFCRVKVFGDAECGRNLAEPVTIDGTDYPLTLTYTGITDVFNFLGEVIFEYAGTDWPDNFFKNGTITATSGPNAGVSREIAASGTFPDDNLLSIKLKRNFPFQMSVTDDFTVLAGCDRTIEDCVKYENIVNRRAEDWIPTVESVHQVPPSS